MKKMMMRRIISLALSLCIAGTLLTGCSSTGQTTAARTQQGQAAVLADTQTQENALENRKLNVSIIQMPILSTPDSLEYLREAVDGLMGGTLRPELVIGVEYGLGFSPPAAGQ